MAQEWQELTSLTQGKPFLVERVRLTGSRIAIEGEFELPPLARLTSEDQIFIMAFVRSEGTIKDMEKTFGVSYPTIKARLSKIAAQMQFGDMLPLTIMTESKTETETTGRKGDRDDILAALEKGEITAAEAIERLSK